MTQVPIGSRLAACCTNCSAGKCDCDWSVFGVMAAVLSADCFRKKLVCFLGVNPRTKNHLKFMPF